jgi:hypothetical protein
MHAILTRAHSVLQTCVFSSFLNCPSVPLVQVRFLQGSPSGEGQLSPSWKQRNTVAFSFCSRATQTEIFKHKEANMRWTGDPQCWTHKPQDYSYSHTCSLIVEHTMIPSREGAGYFAVLPLFSLAVSV